MKKHIGLIGLGKMGENMVLNLLDKNWKVTIYNRGPEPTKKLSKRKNITPSYDYEKFISSIPKPRTIILMVTAGKPVNEVISELAPKLNKGDVIIDGGNSYYEDSIRRHKELSKKGIHFLDMGTSGGLEGARNGASLMIGGNKKVYNKLIPLFKSIATKNGFGYMGESGAGHFVKTVHNGIEYSLLESYAEGYEVLSKSKYNLDLKEISKVWNNGSVIRSWMTELAEKTFSKNKNLSNFKGKIGGGETGHWALKIARKNKSEAKNLKHAIRKRKSSLKHQTFGTKFISAIRNEFGGHIELK